MRSSPWALNCSQIKAMREGCLYCSGRTSNALIKLKTALFAPIANASVSIAITVNPGLFAKPRSATLISLSIIAGDCRFYISLGRDPAVFHHSSVEQVHRAIGVLREALIVRDHAD